MAGFGNPQQNRKFKHNASKAKTEEAIKQSFVAYRQRDFIGAKALLEKSLKVDQGNSFALGFLATIEKALGNNERALKLFKRSTDLDENNPDILNNYSELLIKEDPKKRSACQIKLSKFHQITADTSREMDTLDGK